MWKMWRRLVISYMSVFAQDKSDLVMKRLPDEIKSAGGVLTELRAIPSTLEDVFIALSEDERILV